MEEMVLHTNRINNQMNNFSFSLNLKTAILNNYNQL